MDLQNNFLDEEGKLIPTVGSYIDWIDDNGGSVHGTVQEIKLSIKRDDGEVIDVSV